jgi:trk system potassium uptake protein TrkA
MKAIIVGGGKVGYYIYKTLKEKHFEVALIEKDKNTCRQIASKLDGEIICGDGSELEVLQIAGIQDAEIVAAVTGKDEENLVICQMAKMDFNVGKTIARINNPKNRPIFKALGVDKTVCSTEVIANLIEDEFENDDVKIVQTLDRGEMILLEASIGKKSKWKGSLINSLHLPNECVIASILRKDTVIFPRGHIEIKEGDKVLIITNMENKVKIEMLI